MGTLFLALLLSSHTSAANDPLLAQLKSGDVVLHTSKSRLSLPIREATKSPYSHVGMIEVDEKGEVFVLEAIEPVSRTPWSRWKARGEGSKVTVLRSTLKPSELARVQEWAKAQLGRPYDVRFQWDDEKLYCSELVSKAFEHGSGKPWGRRERIRDLSLSYADKRLAKSLGVSLDTELVSPAGLAADARFVTIWSDFDKP